MHPMTVGLHRTRIRCLKYALVTNFVYQAVCATCDDSGHARQRDLLEDALDDQTFHCMVAAGQDKMRVTPLRSYLDPMLVLNFEADMLLDYVWRAEL